MTTLTDPATVCAATRHNTANAYDNHGCRCLPAREAHRIGRGRRELRRALLGPQVVSGVGTARRLQALCVMGWPLDPLAHELGMVPSYVAELRVGRDHVYRDTAVVVALLYDTLTRKPGPSIRARARGQRRGWAPPDAWDDSNIDDPSCLPWNGRLFLDDDDAIDQVAVERVARGGTYPLNRHEKYAAYARMRDLATPGTQISEQLKINGQTQAAFRERYAASMIGATS